MDSSLIPLYEWMLKPNVRRQKGKVTNLRHEQVVNDSLDVVDALEKIRKVGAHFCKLPINEEILKDHPQADKDLDECCAKSFDSNNIINRIKELLEDHEDSEECKLLAEAEECGVDILLIRNGSFKQNLQNKVSRVRIFHPLKDLKEIVGY